MGVKLRVGLLTCGTCGKPRGLRHTCVTRATSRRRKARTRVRLHVSATCKTCGKPRRIAHVCKPKSDFRARRRKQASADRKARGKKRKTAAKRKRRASRPRGDGHEPGTCGDRDCPRFGCKSYWQGMDDCPLPHNS